MDNYLIIENILVGHGIIMIVICYQLTFLIMWRIIWLSMGIKFIHISTWKSKTFQVSNFAAIIRILYSWVGMPVRVRKQQV